MSMPDARDRLIYINMRVTTRTMLSLSSKEDAEFDVSWRRQSRRMRPQLNSGALRRSSGAVTLTIQKTTLLRLTNPIIGRKAFHVYDRPPRSIF
jgi:hypothetical protein